MSSQNKAMKDVLIWNLPAKLTCYKPSPLCAKHCYAMATENRWPNTTKCRFDNLKSTKDINFVDNLICVIRSEVIKNKPTKRKTPTPAAWIMFASVNLALWAAKLMLIPPQPFLPMMKTNVWSEIH
jgi:hypothetical protein